MIRRPVRTFDRSHCGTCGAEVVRALVRPLGPEPAAARPRRFIDLNPVPLGYAPDDHDIEAETRASGVRTFGIYLGVVTERNGEPGHLPERIHAQHWCNLPEALEVAA